VRPKFRLSTTITHGPNRSKPIVLDCVFLILLRSCGCTYFQIPTVSHGDRGIFRYYLQRFGERRHRQRPPNCERQYLLQQAFNHFQIWNMASQPRKPRRCGVCGAEGHHKRICPVARAQQANNLAILDSDNQNAGAGGPSGTQIEVPPPQNVNTINWDKVCYILFDLETTGGSRTDEDIIQISAMLLDPFGISIEEGIFTSYIHTNKEIGPYITSLTGITNSLVKDAPDFCDVATDFFCFLDDTVATSFCADNPPVRPIEHIIFVAHNGRAFDVPFLLNSLRRHNMLEFWTDDDRLGYIIDTLDIARKISTQFRQDPIEGFWSYELQGQNYIKGSKVWNKTLHADWCPDRFCSWGYCLHWKGYIRRGDHGVNQEDCPGCAEALWTVQRYLSDCIHWQVLHVSRSFEAVRRYELICDGYRSKQPRPKNDDFGEDFQGVQGDETGRMC